MVILDKDRVQRKTTIIETDNSSGNISEADYKNEPSKSPLKHQELKKIGYLVGALAGGNALTTALRMVSCILMARLMEPAELGLFSGIGLVLGYAPFFQVGIANGLNRELPYFIGKGDKIKANELASAAQAWLILIGILAAILLLTVAGYHLYNGNFWQAAGWGAHSVLIFSLFYSTFYLQVTFRTAHDFARLALINVCDATISLVLLVLIWQFNFYGLCLRSIITTIISAALFYYWRPVRIGPRWDFSLLKHLFTIGAPIFISGQVYSWWGVINQTLVLSYTGTHGMGLYAMVNMTSGVMTLIPSSLSQVIYPRMVEQFGSSGKLRDLNRMVIKPMLLSAICMAPMAAVAWWLVEPVVRFLVPKYVEAVPAVQWALLQPIIMCFSPINSIFDVIRRQDLHLTAILCGMAVYGVSLMWLIRDGVSLVVFPQAMLIGYAAFIFACYAFLLYLQRKEIPIGKKSAV